MNAPAQQLVDVDKLSLLEKIRRLSLAADVAGTGGQDRDRMLTALREAHADYYQRFQKGRG